jgi:hypothetical protein
MGSAVGDGCFKCGSVRRGAFHCAVLSEETKPRENVNIWPPETAKHNVCSVISMAMNRSGLLYATCFNLNAFCVLLTQYLLGLVIEITTAISPNCITH